MMSQLRHQLTIGYDARIAPQLRFLRRLFKVESMEHSPLLCADVARGTEAVRGSPAMSSSAGNMTAGSRGQALTSRGRRAAELCQARARGNGTQRSNLVHVCRNYLPSLQQRLMMKQ